MLTYAGIAVISAATILLELALLRLFAVQQFYHFAFMAISLALLGAGASGSILSLRRRHGDTGEFLEKKMMPQTQFRSLSPAALCLAFGGTTIGAYLIINYLPFDSFSIAWDKRQILYLAGYFLAAAGPFLFSGLLVGSQLMVAGQKDEGPGSHQIYGANLIGSALGGVVSLPSLALFGGEGTVVLVAVFGAVSALLFALERLRRSGGQGRNLVSVGLAAGFGLAGLIALYRPPAILTQQLSPYKTLSILKSAMDANHTITEWDATARIDVVESSTIHIMPGLSLLAPTGVPPQAGLMIDGDSLMPVTGLDPDSEEAGILADYLPNGLAFRLRPKGRTLVIEAGAGMDVLFALAAGANRVTVVEENGLLLEVVNTELDAFTGGLYSDHRVDLVNQSGRVFVRQPGRIEDPYDLAIVALTDPHRPVTSGAYSLTEDTIHTVEAFRDYLRILDDDGLLVVTRWTQIPPSESGRTFGTIAAALEAGGLEPAEHLIAYRTLRTMTIVAARQPWQGEELETIRDFLGTRGFDPVYLPDIRLAEVNQTNVLMEPVYYDLFQRILTDPDRLYSEYRFDIRPPTDDRPFFFHYFKWGQTQEILSTLGLTWQPFGGSGFFVLVALLLLVGLASAVLIIGPLLFRRGEWRARPAIPVLARRPHWRLRVWIYFACLGLAFLFVEIPLAQRFILVLDHPVTALAVVLFSILLFSGLGSLTVRRWRLSWGLAALIALIVVYPLLLDPVSALALRLPEWGRIALTVLLMAPLGYLMGLPFAGGLRVVERHEAALVPWAWAVNGTFSVMGSVLAVMVALSWGFSVVLWLGAAAYTGALLSFRTLLREG